MTIQKSTNVLKRYAINLIAVVFVFVAQDINAGSLVVIASEMIPAHFPNKGSEPLELALASSYEVYLVSSQIQGVKTSAINTMRGVTSQTYLCAMSTPIFRPFGPTDLYAKAEPNLDDGELSRTLGSIPDGIFGHHVTVNTVIPMSVISTDNPEGCSPDKAPASGTAGTYVDVIPDPARPDRIYTRSASYEPDRPRGIDPHLGVFAHAEIMVPDNSVLGGLGDTVPAHVNRDIWHGFYVIGSNIGGSSIRLEAPKLSYDVDLAVDCVRWGTLNTVHAKATVQIQAPWNAAPTSHEIQLSETGNIKMDPLSMEISGNTWNPSVTKFEDWDSACASNLEVMNISADAVAQISSSLVDSHAKARARLAIKSLSWNRYIKVEECP